MKQLNPPPKPPSLLGLSTVPVQIKFYLSNQFINNSEKQDISWLRVRV